MPTVIFSTELQRATGEEKATVDAATYRELIEELTLRYGDLDRTELLDMAVAIDGVIIQDPMLEPLGDNSEIHFLYPIRGG